jgi:hypothetical protein
MVLYLKECQACEEEQETQSNLALAALLRRIEKKKAEMMKTCQGERIEEGKR